MSRKVHIVLLCEDTQHESFVRRFLGKTGWSRRDVRVQKAPGGRGSAERFVRERFPKELKALRRRNQRSLGLVVMLDGDNQGVDHRIGELDAACGQHGVPCREPGEHVLVLVPTWCIETWLAYLDGETVSEQRRDYPRLPNEGDCKSHVDNLVAMYRKGELREPAPPSLVAACAEHRRWSGAMRRG